MRFGHSSLLAVSAFFFGISLPAGAQQVCLPLPRLLTTMPMGGQVGSTGEVTITGENIENISALLFSTPKITAKPVPGTENKFTVSIAPDAPLGVHDARVLSRLGVSSALAKTGFLGESPSLIRRTFFSPRAMRRNSW